MHAVLILAAAARFLLLNRVRSGKIPHSLCHNYTPFPFSRPPPMPWDRKRITWANVMKPQLS